MEMMKNEDHDKIIENTSGVVNVKTEGRGTNNFEGVVGTTSVRESVGRCNGSLDNQLGPEAQLFSSFLGMIARSSRKIGLQYESWHKVPKTLKDELLNFIEELKSGKKIGHFEFSKATHTKKDGSYLNKETEEIMEKANEKLSEYQSIDGDEGMVETEILTQVIGKERHGRVRGLGLGPTPTSYYGHSDSRRLTTCSGHSSECIEFRQQMNEKFQKMEDELGQERANYNALYTFLQQQFPGATIPLPTIGGSSSQSQNQASPEH
ncbi:uncharacterized protein LOC120279664 [Dioscorea cayenensis subsp. rotundata]|uniref:Uncharacterized protein LOC120279664 n=1 Tax=Dioscorea cayennensis subsp. rotundata TaxID=55577 RepID=A0AB40CR46_DIOCR|nr:uncharacterized protein LOC120279664 [Dioscorea cayenensis subsp. rotundata]